MLSSSEPPLIKKLQKIWPAVVALARLGSHTFRPFDFPFKDVLVPGIPGLDYSNESFRLLWETRQA
jgi:hypothetical protein